MSLSSALSALRPPLAALAAPSRIGALLLVAESEPLSLATSSLRSCLRAASLLRLSAEARAITARILPVIMQGFVEDGCGAQACLAHDRLDPSPPSAPFVLPARGTSATTRAAVLELALDAGRSFKATNAPDALLELLRSLPPPPPGELWSVVEVGVFRGDTTEALLSEEPRLRVLAVDPFDFAAPNYAPPVGLGAAPSGARPGDALRVAERLDRFRPRVAYFPMPSLDAARFVAPGSAELVYLDGDHRHAAIEADIRAWAPIVAAGGILAGHDHALDFPGVIAAVRAFADARGLRVHLGPIPRGGLTSANCS
eukprot:TRINITY_DN17178_c0_g1_i1.p1 TRINITY_DN17178_c0_g1~~TRINITY_DN17178_c0_g1_i1.p1  ORF type:complete len:320 (-),score=71.21 TRINITY_DN17178_c0_g1_i1:6-944(-)